MNRTYADTSSRIRDQITVGLWHRRRHDGRHARGRTQPSQRASRAGADRAVRESRFDRLDFEFFVFVARLESHRRQQRPKAIGPTVRLKIIDPGAGARFQLRGIEPYLQARSPRPSGTAMPAARPEDSPPRRHRPIPPVCRVHSRGRRPVRPTRLRCPPELLIARYGNDVARFIDIGGTPRNPRSGSRDGIPVVLIHGSMGSLHMWEGWVHAR